MSEATHQLDRADQMIRVVEQKGGVITKQQLKLSMRGVFRAMRVTIAIVALIALSALATAIYVLPKVATTQSQTELNTASLNAYGEAIDELRRQGVPESQLPPALPASPTDELDVNAIVQASAATVLAHIRSNPAFRGQPGTPGQPCNPNAEPLCQGPRGEPGTNGTNGVNGVDGADGKDGENGQNGQDGQDGAPGKDAPTPSSAEFVRNDDGTCVYRTTYSDGSATNAQTNPGNCI